MKKYIYIAFLRGINVGGHRKVNMKVLKEMLSGMGLQQVNTYIQSGNVAFVSEIEDAPALQNQIESKIASQFGLEVKVILRSASEIHQVLSENPYLTTEDDTSKLYFTMLDDVPGQAELEKLLTYTFPHDEYQVLGKTVYLHCINGYGRTKLTNDFFEKKLKRIATTRNWKTMLKMREMVNELD